MSQQFYDRVRPANVRRTADGYLVADAPVARTGIQLYRGAEMGKPEVPFVRVYRPAGEVFHKDAMHSYAHRPMTNDHPPVMVDSANWKDFAIGQTGDEVMRDGDRVRVPLVMMDQKAITDYENGKSELSMGYTAVIDWSPGETEDGLEYDAVQRELRMNHLALVQKGRAGNARIGDEGGPTKITPTQKGGLPMADNLKKVMVDGLSVETTDQGAEAIRKLQGQLKDADTAKAQADAAHQAAIEAKDKELATKDAEIETLKSKQLDGAALDARVTQRAQLLSDAKRLHDADYKGMADADIRKAVVKAKCGDAAVTDRSEAYIDARFDALLDAAPGKDPVHQQISGHQPAPVVDADGAYSSYVDSLVNGTYHNPPAAQ